MRLKGFMKVQSSLCCGDGPEAPQGDLFGEGLSELLSEEAPLAFPPLLCHSSQVILFPYLFYFLLVKLSFRF